MNDGEQKTALKYLLEIIAIKYVDDVTDESGLKSPIYRN